MSRQTRNSLSPTVAFAAALAVAVAAPIALDKATWNSAAAQLAGADTGTDAGVRDESGEAQDFVESPRKRVGGTGSIGISSGEQRYADPASVNVVSNDYFRRYSKAAEENDLQKAAAALAVAADRPVTKDYVVAVNEQLGVRTALQADQIADAATDEAAALPY